MFAEKQNYFKILEFKQSLPLTIESNVILISFFNQSLTILGKLVKKNLISLK